MVRDTQLWSSYTPDENNRAVPISEMVPVIVSGIIVWTLFVMAAGAGNGTFVWDALT